MKRKEGSDEDSKPSFRLFEPRLSLSDHFHDKTNRRNDEYDPDRTKCPLVQKDFCMLRHFITSTLSMRDGAWCLFGLTPFLILSVFFMSGPRCGITLFLIGRAWVCRRGNTSGHSSISCRSSFFLLFPSWRCLLGFFDPGTVVTFAWCCLADPGRHGVVPSNHCSLSLTSL